MTWLGDPTKATFLSRYETARHQLLEHWADEIVEIADDSTNDFVERKMKDGMTDKEKAEWVYMGETVGRSRLRIDSRKWLLSKLKPEKYGEKLLHTGAGGDGPVEVTFATYAEMTTWGKDKGEK